MKESQCLSSPTETPRKHMILKNRHGQTLKVPLRVLSPFHESHSLSNSQNKLGFLEKRKSQAAFYQSPAKLKTESSSDSIGQKPKQKFIFDSSSLQPLEKSHKSFHPVLDLRSPKKYNKTQGIDTSSDYFPDSSGLNGKGIQKTERTFAGNFLRDVSHLNNSASQFKKKFSEHNVNKSNQNYFTNIVRKGSPTQNHGSLPDLGISPHFGDSDSAITAMDIPLFDMIEAGSVNKDILKSKEFLEECLSFEKKLKKYEVSVKSVAFENILVLHEALKTQETPVFGKSSSSPKGIDGNPQTEASFHNSAIQELSKSINENVQKLKKTVPNIFQGVPCSRQELEGLLQHLKSKLKEMNKNPSHEKIEQMNIGVTLVMHEVLHQVILQSYEKGEILVFVWNAYFALLSKLVRVSAEKSAALARRVWEKMERKEKESDRLKARMMEIINEKQEEIEQLKKKNMDQAQKIDVQLETDKITRKQTFLLKNVINKSLVKINFLNAENTKLKQKMKKLKEKNQKSEEKPESDEESLEENHKMKSAKSISEPDFDEFDVNYDVNNDPDFKEDFQEHGEALSNFKQGLDDENGGQVIGNLDLFDKYTEISFDNFLRNSVERETQTNLELVTGNFDDIFHSKAALLSATGDYRQKVNYMRKNVDLYNLDKEALRIDISTQESMRKTFDVPEEQNEASERAKMRRTTFKGNFAVSRLNSQLMKEEDSIAEVKEEKTESKAENSLNGAPSAANVSSNKSSICLPKLSSLESLSPIKLSSKRRNFGVGSILDGEENPNGKLIVFVNGFKLNELAETTRERLRPRLWRIIRFIKALQLFKVENSRNEELQAKLSETEEKLQLCKKERDELKQQNEESEELLNKIRKRFAVDLEQLKNMSGFFGEDLEETQSKFENNEEKNTVILEEATEKEEKENSHSESGNVSADEELKEENQNEEEKPEKRKTRVMRPIANKNPTKYMTIRMFQDDKNALVLLEKAKQKKMAKNIHLFPLKLVLKQITNVYRERYNQTRDKSEHKDECLASFVYNIYRNQYGTTKFLDQKFIIFILSLRRNQHLLRVSTFAKFFQVFNESSNYSIDEFNKYMEGYEFFQTSNFGVSVPNGEADQNHFVPFLRCMEYFKYFSDKKLSLEEIQKFRIEIQKMKEKDPSGANSFGIVNMDAFLVKILGLYREMVQKTKLYVESAFNAADLDGNGYIEPEEFMILWKHLNPERFNFFECDRVFNANSMTMENGERGLPFDKFTQICFSDGLFKHEVQLAFCKISSMDQVSEVFLSLRENWPSLKEKLSQRLENCDLLEDKRAFWWKEVISRIDQKINDCPSSMHLSFIIGIRIVEKETRELFGTYIENKHSKEQDEIENLKIVSSGGLSPKFLSLQPKNSLNFENF